MNALEKFVKYAADFEASYEDDQWERIKPYFADGAVYEVASRTFGATLRGPDEIVGGFKKSLNGFDRLFETRKIDVLGAPEVGEDEVSAEWTASYTKEGCTPLVLRGRSAVRYEGDKIIRLIDSYTEAAEIELQEWNAANDLAIDPSYT